MLLGTSAWKMTGEFWLLVIKKSIWLEKEHYQRLLNEEFEWDKVNLSVNEPIIEPQSQTDKESIKNLK